MLQIVDPAWPLLLERACSEDLITPVFQPIVDLARGVVCGFEGLARIRDPDVEAGPQEWFAAAALHGFSGRLEAAAVATMLDRRPDLPKNCFLSVNLSPDALSAPEVRAVLERPGDLSGLIIEITEQTPVDDYDALTEVLGELRSRGAMVAVDDTGAGYASLSHLLALRPEFVKLDRGLVEGVDRDPHRAAAVAAIGAFAGELDAWVVAEGVESQAELERVIELGVPLVQGYLLGCPSGDMVELSESVAARLRARHGLKRAGTVSVLARPAPVVREVPDLVAETTILVDDHGRPREVLVRVGGRTQRHVAMCVQAGDGVGDVALRAAARQSDDRYGPICVCDELGQPLGIVAIETLLETLARQAPRRADPTQS